MKKTPKLVLHQETLRNLNEDELRRIEGGFFTQIALCRTNFVSCPECNPPRQKQGK